MPLPGSQFSTAEYNEISKHTRNESINRHKHPLSDITKENRGARVSAPYFLPYYKRAWHTDHPPLLPQVRQADSRLAAPSQSTHSTSEHPSQTNRGEAAARSAGWGTALFLLWVLGLLWAGCAACTSLEPHGTLLSAPDRCLTYFCKSLVIKTMHGILLISSFLLSLPKTWSSAFPATSTEQYCLFCWQQLMMITHLSFLCKILSNNRTRQKWYFVTQFC